MSTDSLITIAIMFANLFFWSLVLGLAMQALEAWRTRPRKSSDDQKKKP